MKNYIFTIIIIAFMVGCREVIPVAPEESRSTIFINSSPIGAQIYLESNNTGRSTPDSISNLAPGNYSITLKLIGYRDTTFGVAAPEGFDPRVFVRFRDN